MRTFMMIACLTVRTLTFGVGAFVLAIEQGRATGVPALSNTL